MRVEEELGRNRSGKIRTSSFREGKQGGIKGTVNYELGPVGSSDH